MRWRASSSCDSGQCIQVASWRTSTRSAGNGACLEAASFRRSSKCVTGECVEAGHGPGIVGVRDSVLGEASPVLEFPAEAWRRFAADLKSR